MKEMGKNNISSAVYETDEIEWLVFLTITVGHY